MVMGLFVALAAAVFLLVAGFGDVDFETGPGVALLNIRGELADEECVLDQLDSLANHPDTRAIVLRVDSPGGEITVAEEIFNGIAKAKEKHDLPVVASMGSTAASGGYFVCCAADRVFANKTTMTGSLGVIAEYPNAESLLSKVGVEIETIASGEFKSAGSLAKSLTEAQRHHIQDLIQEYHEMFVVMISEGRSMDANRVRELADGRLFTGQQALDEGLVDEIGDLDDALRYAARQAGIKGDPRIIRPDEEPLSWQAVVDEFWTAASRAHAPRWKPRWSLK